MSDDLRDLLIRALHNEGDGGVWEHFDRANATAVADALLPVVAAHVAEWREIAATLDRQGDTALALVHDWMARAVAAEERLARVEATLDDIGMHESRFPTLREVDASLRAALATEPTQ